ncbi:hypothetical protein D3C76_1872930 [compost metagenome]
MNWLVVGGMMVRMAWGRVTRQKITVSLRPRAREASRWPLGTPRIPARKISLR